MRSPRQGRAYAANPPLGKGISSAGVRPSMTRRRPLYAWYRFSRSLLHEFRWPLGVFIALVLLGEVLLKCTYREEPLTHSQANHVMFLMVFVEQTLKSSHAWCLQPHSTRLIIAPLLETQGSTRGLAGQAVASRDLELVYKNAEYCRPPGGKDGLEHRV